MGKIRDRNAPPAPPAIPLCSELLYYKRHGQAQEDTHTTARTELVRLAAAERVEWPARAERVKPDPRRGPARETGREPRHKKNKHDKKRHPCWKSVDSADKYDEHCGHALRYGPREKVTRKRKNEEKKKIDDREKRAKPERLRQTRGGGRVEWSSGREWPAIERAFGVSAFRGQGSPTGSSVRGALCA